MITCGIDMGAKTIKVIILNDGQIIGKSKYLSGLEPKKNAEIAYEKALENAGMERTNIDRVRATGVGRKDVPFSEGDITEVGADAKGIISIMPNTRTIVDIGAEEGRGIRINEAGKVIDFAVNEKCAAGAGSFTESMARALELTLEEFGNLSLESTESVPMNAQCAVFAESEVVSMLHDEVPKKDIAKAVHDAIASRITSMVRKVGFQEDVALIGGMAFNKGFISSLEADLKVKVKIPDDFEHIGALGAAISAAEGA